MQKQKLNIVIFYGSVREKRQGIKAARFIENKLKERGHAVYLVDPLKDKLPLLGKKYSEYFEGKAPSVLKKLAKKISSADAYIIVSAEYNHGPPPALKNTLDYFYKEYFFRIRCNIYC